MQAQDGPGRRPVQPDRSTRLPSFSSFDRYPGNQAGMHAAERVRGSRRREGRAGAPPPERPPGLDPASNRAPRPYAPILLTCFRPSAVSTAGRVKVLTRRDTPSAHDPYVTSPQRPRSGGKHSRTNGQRGTTYPDLMWAALKIGPHFATSAL